MAHTRKRHKRKLSEQPPVGYIATARAAAQKLRTDPVAAIKKMRTLSAKDARFVDHIGAHLERFYPLLQELGVETRLVSERQLNADPVVRRLRSSPRLRERCLALFKGRMRRRRRRASR